jgi:hypothetical protein
VTPRRPLLAFLATLAASVGARAATVGPIENLPAAQAIGREAFPVDPIGRTWTYRRPDGTSVRREIRRWSYDCIDRKRSGAECFERAVASTTFAADGSPGRERVLTVDACRDVWVRHALDWRDPGGEWAPPDLERVWFPLKFPLVQGLAWEDTSHEVDGPRATREEPRHEPDTTYRVAGQARVEVSAGRFPITAVLDITPKAGHGPQQRRVFHAANVGPVLEQVKNAAGAWVTDLELESYEAKPTSVVVSTDRQLAGHDTHRTAVPAPIGAAVPSHAEISPLEPIPNGANIGAEIFPLSPHHRMWSYVRVSSGTEVRRFTDTTRPRDEHTSALESALILAPGLDERGPRYFAHSTGIEFRFDFGLRAPAMPWMPAPIHDGSEWSSVVPELGDPELRMFGARPHRVLGRAQVVTPAGTFESAVVVETSDPARDDVTERPIRRTYYAANVGPVLVLVPEGADKWVADLVLESYSVPPAEPARQRAATGATPTKHPNAARAARAPAP